eukprot:128331-Prorocentrum_minimum.AAC.1
MSCESCAHPHTTRAPQDLNSPSRALTSPSWALTSPSCRACPTGPGARSGRRWRAGVWRSGGVHRWQHSAGGVHRWQHSATMSDQCLAVLEL